jgi:hypothetical protein
MSPAVATMLPAFAFAPAIAGFVYRLAHGLKTED